MLKIDLLSDHVKFKLHRCKTKLLIIKSETAELKAKLVFVIKDPAI